MKFGVSGSGSGAPLRGRHAPGNGTKRLALAALVLISACSCSNYQHEAFRPGDKALVHTDDYDLRFVEADDYGWLWDPAQATQALDAVRESVTKRDTIVLIFVAGWHHSSQCCDDNIEGFKQVLTNLKTELSQDMYRDARKALHGVSGTEIPPIQVLGIYLGWRGRSLPGLVDYLTFWGRKAAAERVGDTDFEEFLVRLKDFYEAYEQESLPEFSKPGKRPNLLGLVTIGHSFGGQVVLRATSSYLEHSLTDASMASGTGPGYLRKPPKPASGVPLKSPLRGFGDLVVLINPAVEAAAYERLHALGLSQNYAPDQAPVMLTVSADDDGPRHSLFRIGRILGEWFTGKPGLDDAREREMQRQALGVHEEQITHRLEPADGTVKLTGTTRKSIPEPACKGHTECEYTWYAWGPHTITESDSLSAARFTPSVVQQIGQYDLSSRTVFAGVVMRPLGGAIPRQALIVASADPRIITGHNGMFSDPLMNFLTRYIGFVEAKRLLPVAASVEAQGGPNAP